MVSITVGDKKIEVTATDMRFDRVVYCERLPCYVFTTKDKKDTVYISFSRSEIERIYRLTSRKFGATARND